MEKKKKKKKKIKTKKKKTKKQISKYIKEIYLSTVFFLIEIII